jgi:hypothetical protein
VTTRTPCGHKPTARAEFLYMLPDGSRMTSCGRGACDHAYQFDGATEFSDAEGCRSAIEIPALSGESPDIPGAGSVDAGLAPLPFQSEMF